MLLVLRLEWKSLVFHVEQAVICAEQIMASTTPMFHVKRPAFDRTAAGRSRDRKLAGAGSRRFSAVAERSVLSSMSQTPRTSRPGPLSGWRSGRPRPFCLQRAMSLRRKHDWAACSLSGRHRLPRAKTIRGPLPGGRRLSFLEIRPTLRECQVARWRWVFRADLHRSRSPAPSLPREATAHTEYIQQDAGE